MCQGSYNHRWATPIGKTAVEEKKSPQPPQIAKIIDDRRRNSAFASTCTAMHPEHICLSGWLSCPFDDETKDIVSGAGKTSNVTRLGRIHSGSFKIGQHLIHD